MAEAIQTCPEPVMHSEHILRITQLDYLRLRSWLTRECGALEYAAQRAESEGNIEFAQFMRTEVCHISCIMDGLESRWKPGRAPGQIGRDSLQTEAIEAARKEPSHD